MHKLGPIGEDIVNAMRAGLAFLDGHSTAEILKRVGGVVEELPPVASVDKRVLQDSFGGSSSGPCDDLLVGRGLFYISEQRRLFLDCTSGHYQMLWGYSDPELWASVCEAAEAGIVWDNHCNIPQTPVKLLGRRLVELAGPRDGPDPLDTVLLGCCTGSIACAAALKIQLAWYQRRAGTESVPVVVVLDGNYHGTDMVCQNLRGMWGRYVRNIEVVTVESNDADALQSVFRRYGERVAGFWAEPILMNREAIVLDRSYLQLARVCCDQTGALMCIDEIQTGFWQPEVFAFRSLGIVPDLVVAGKGMTAGFHPLAALIYKSRFDLLEQYDAISTNGSAPLPSYVALCCLDRIEANAAQLVSVGDAYMTQLKALAAEFSDIVVDARGKRHMMGLKFRRVEDALDFHRRALEAGLWVRVHAYHEGHSTVLTKLALAADHAIVDYVVATFRTLLRSQSDRA